MIPSNFAEVVVLRTRVITAIIALAVMLSVFIFAQPDFMRWFFTLLVGLSGYETATMILSRLFQPKAGMVDGFKMNKIVWAIVSFSCLIFWFCSTFQEHRYSLLVVSLLLILLLSLFVVPEIDLSFSLASSTLTIIAYSTLPWLAIWELYQLATDSSFIFLMCVIVWSGDTGAYFTGKKLGRRKLAPLISPNKTWEGAIGGLTASIVGAWIFKSLNLFLMPNWLVLTLCAVVGGRLGQLGDLAESSFKRFAGVKDSGSIFPGHGGFLDRVDGLLFAAPAIWFILYQFGG